MTSKFPYRRILLKLSGEILRGSQGEPFSNEKCHQLAEAIKTLQQVGVQVGIVIGGGNIVRGHQAKDLGLERVPADQMGMLATIMNGIVVQQALQQVKCPARVMSAIDCPRIVESFQWQKALRSLEQGDVLIFAGGTGNPFFTTDTAAALRASEIKAEILLKATKVDGVYSKDPVKDPSAKKYAKISYQQVLAEKLEVMDASSIAMCMSASIPIFVFQMQLLHPQHILNIFDQQSQGTLIQT